MKIVKPWFLSKLMKDIEFWSTGLFRKTYLFDGFKVVLHALDGNVLASLDALGL